MQTVPKARAHAEPAPPRPRGTRAKKRPVRVPRHVRDPSTARRGRHAQSSRSRPRAPDADSQPRVARQPLNQAMNHAAGELCLGHADDHPPPPARSPPVLAVSRGHSTGTNNACCSPGPSRSHHRFTASPFQKITWKEGGAHRLILEATPTNHCQSNRSGAAVLIKSPIGTRKTVSCSCAIFSIGPKPHLTRALDQVSPSVRATGPQAAGISATKGGALSVFGLRCSRRE